LENPISALFLRPPSRNRIRCNFSGLTARRLSRRWQQERSQHQHPPPPPAPSCQFSSNPPPQKKTNKKKKNLITFPIPGKDRAGSHHLVNLLIKKGPRGIGGGGGFLFYLFPPSPLFKEPASTHHPRWGSACHPAPQG